MARSFKDASAGIPTDFRGQAIQIQRPKVTPFSVYNLIALRRIKYSRAFALLIASSVFLSVTVSFLMTTIIAKNVEVLTAKVRLTKLPFEGLVLFENEKVYDTFLRKVRFPGSVEKVQYAEIQSSMGKLLVLGAANDLSDDTLELLFALEGKPSKGEYTLTSWLGDYPITKLGWSKPTQGDSTKSGSALQGWAVASPSSVKDLPNARPAILLKFAGAYKFDPMNPAAAPRTASFLTDIENKAPAGARVITAYSGTLSLKRSAKGAFSSWQLISLIVLLSSAAAITCILTVSFLGRKRSLGIFRVLGGTIADLRRSMSLEAVYVGLPGLLLGVFVGHNLARLLEIGSVLPWSAYVVATITGGITLMAGVWMPLQLIKNANCDQLLNNRPVYVISNPSCANCGLCGGI